ncbi:hypothetical protein [Paracoccus mutanolyticus]|uniref:hypothetical protein n=1 Tax=Paracoccus mutanolyticus TaxID=1499308 RepID=UPI001679B39E|nr:hypothetical protein [Paracoccus mutanolyticus]
MCRSHPKGKILADAWGKALHIHNAGLRSQELKRVSTFVMFGTLVVVGIKTLQRTDFDTTFNNFMVVGLAMSWR